ncbi:MAG: hypothetical protein KDD82_31090, partial [Planctomycetes bacterium]|nr:hypothetical protein [Planctomycetota bacterium]
FARAEARARERVAAEPDDPDALLVLARVLGLRLKDREALEVAVHGLSVAADRGPFLGLLHVIHTRAGQREEAQRIRARLVAEAPDGPDAWLAQMTRTDVTLEERWEQLKGWVAERPDELRVHLSTVSQEAVTGAGDACFRAALERFPEAQGLLRYFRLQGLSCSDPASALAALARWFPAREQDLDLLCLEAELLLALDQRAAAQARAELACRLDPSSLRAWTWLLTSVKRLGDPALLRTAAERALNAVALEDRWRFEHELGYLALRDRRNGDALRHARAMGSGALVLGARAALEATALRCLGRGEEALEVVDAWTRAEPRDPRAWTERAKHLSAAGRHAEVEPCAETAVDLDPSQGVAWELLAGARFGLGARGERLERPLHEALRLGVDTPGLRLMLATVAFEAGRFAEARAHVDAGRAARTPEPVLADLELLDRRLQARGL